VQGHPYFQSAPIWHPTLASALADVQAGDRRVFLTIGRIDCGGSRALVEKTIGKEEIFEYLTERFACVALDAEQLTPDAEALVAQMKTGQPAKRTTPMCLYVDGQGRLVLDTTGGRPAAVFLNDLVEAATRRVL
jgi:hypothetical protein